MILYSDIILDLSERQDELQLARQDVLRAEKQINVIEETVIELGEAKDDYQVDMSELKRNYEDSVNSLQTEYDSASNSSRKEMMQEIRQRFDNFQKGFSSMRQNFHSSLDRVIIAIEDKINGLKIASVNQRSMVMVLFEDYCDALFYHRFLECKEDTVPFMSDDFDMILEKLNFLQWDTITSIQHLPTIPQVFTGRRVVIEDNEKYQITNFKRNG